METTISNIEQARRAQARYARLADIKGWARFAELLGPELQFRLLDPAGNLSAAFDDRDSFVDAARTKLEGAQSIPEGSPHVRGWRASSCSVQVTMKEKGMKEPWCLATSLHGATAAQVVALDSRRFTIEESFRDTKDLRFGMGLSSMSIAEPARQGYGRGAAQGHRAPEARRVALRGGAGSEGRVVPR
jgi:hypothetical protein